MERIERCTGRSLTITERSVLLKLLTSPVWRSDMEHVAHLISQGRADYLYVQGNGLASRGILDGMTLIYELGAALEPGRLAVLSDDTLGSTTLSVVAVEDIPVLETSVAPSPLNVVGIVRGVLSYTEL